jgi:pimeloyl-ACP methyl ester carboxylesterase
MVAATEALRQCRKPTLVVWATEDRIMPRDHGRRLVDLLPHGTLVEIPDSYTLIPQDRPAELTRAIRDFLG